MGFQCLTNLPAQPSLYFYQPRSLLATQQHRSDLLKAIHVPRQAELQLRQRLHAWWEAR